MLQGAQGLVSFPGPWASPPPVSRQIGLLHDLD